MYGKSMRVIIKWLNKFMQASVQLQFSVQ